MSPEIAPTDSATARSGHDAAHARTDAELVRRLKNVEGHVRGIQKMVGDRAYCIDVLKQINAVRAALDRVGSIALETHLETCVTDRLRSEDAGEQARVIDEILEVFSANAKR
jgi:DNA-binding FrmR family transcriptional regulator